MGVAKDRDEVADSEGEDSADNVAAAEVELVGTSISIPTHMKMVVQLGYEAGMKAKMVELFGDMADEAAVTAAFVGWVTPVMAHIQAIYHDPSFLTTLDIEVIHT